MATNSSSSLMEEISSRKEMRLSKKLYQLSGQAPSPSKDYCQLIVTEKGLIWRRWNITIRNRSHGWYPTPEEELMSYEDFEDDEHFQDQLEQMFGSQSIKDIRRIISGSNGAFSCLPVDLTVLLITYLDLQSITHLSQTNQYFRKLCNFNSFLWKKLYIIHQGQPSADVRAIATNGISWKELFFMNKLQIQKEISRLRRKVITSHHS